MLLLGPGGVRHQAATVELAEDAARRMGEAVWGLTGNHSGTVSLR